MAVTISMTLISGIAKAKPKAVTTVLSPGSCSEEKAKKLGQSFVSSHIIICIKVTPTIIWHSNIVRPHPLRCADKHALKLL